MKSFAEWQDTKKRVRPRFSPGELLELASDTKNQYLAVVRKKRSGATYHYSGDVIEADKNGKLAVVRRMYDVAEDQLARILGVRHKK